MATVLFSELRKGMYVEQGNQLLQVIDTDLRTPGNLPSKLRIWFKSLRTGAVTDVRVHPEDKVTVARLEQRTVQYLYRDGADHVFMDQESFDQFPLPPELLADKIGYLREGDLAIVAFHDDRAVMVELPPTVELTVSETEPGIRTATASAVFKPAVLETGLRITVPPFIETGERILVDTRIGRYAGRAKL